MIAPAFGQTSRRELRPLPHEIGSVQIGLQSCWVGYWSRCGADLYWGI